MTEPIGREDRTSELRAELMRLKSVQLRRRVGLLLFTCAAVALMFVWAVRSVPTLSDSEMDTGVGPYIGCYPGQEFEDQGDLLRAKIDAYYSTHGRYPLSLAEAGVAPADMATEFGEWSLLLLDDGSDYELSVGDYGHNGFVLFWTQSRHGWHTDT